MQGQTETTRVFKVYHADEDVEKELTTIVDLGGTVVDVFVYHKVYGVLRADTVSYTHLTLPTIA